MQDAFKTWDIADETLESVEARIHDGVPREKLHARADGYAKRVLNAAPWLRVQPSDTIVEVGPGVGYIMQAVAERCGAAAITGLDVAPAMIGHAQARLQRDGLSPDRFRFQHYDGVHFPWPDASVDLFYSVAAIQHIPKPFAYNVFLEIHRCLRPHGTAVLHLLSWEFVADGQVNFAEEIRHQVTGTQTHWHHFYDRTELETIVQHVLKASTHRIDARHGSIWLAWQK
jgi:ubiquinone/menaquinone biosynthesis C-methylase UbiE